MTTSFTLGSMVLVFHVEPPKLCPVEQFAPLPSMSCLGHHSWCGIVMLPSNNLVHFVKEIIVPALPGWLFCVLEHASSIYVQSSAYFSI